MHLTDEQKTIVEYDGNAKIHAVAGSGKTSTLIAYAKKRGRTEKILYLAFNRSVRLEAQKRFAEAGTQNVRIDTAHSLAYHSIVSGTNLKVCKGYKPADIVQIMRIPVVGRDPLSPILLASHILRYTSYFCNQPQSKVNDLDYSTQVEDKQALAFVKKNYSMILDGTRKFLAKMNSGEIDLTHDFYLKKFQLSDPKLEYDYILFDEGQDASPVMLNVFLDQEHATKIIVGDIHQQIYSWRYAINALENVNFQDFSLTTSFRFPQRIADLAMKCLKWKGTFDRADDISITGAGKAGKGKLKATLARTNLALLKAAIDVVGESRSKKKVYFEGNLSSYTYAAEGASIWDVLNLYLDKKGNIRDPIVASMNSFEQLEEYADLSEDAELQTLIDMVSEYGKELPYFMNRLKEYHVSDDDRNKADMIFSTVHRCKGLEYDSVSLEDDFIGAAKIKRLGDKKDLSQAEIDKIIEEINLVYVAITRSRNKLTLPAELFDDPQESSQTLRKQDIARKPVFSSKAKSSQPRFSALQAYQPWTSDQDAQLRRMVYDNAPIKEIARKLGRNSGAISSRIRKLGLE